jgi:ABC-2 type transport system ATP-binding protein
MQFVVDRGVVVVGRGRVIADTSVSELIAAVSGDRVTLRTSAPSLAVRVLEGAGACADITGVGVLMVSGLAAEQVVAVLGAHAVPFAEVSAHRVSLEEAYMELTRDAVEYRAWSSAPASAGRGAQ